MIYLFVRPVSGYRGPMAFGYQHHWPELRRLIWKPFQQPATTPRRLSRERFGRLLHRLSSPAVATVHDHERRQAPAPRASATVGCSSGHMRQLRSQLRRTLPEGVGRVVDVSLPSQAEDSRGSVRS